jgi:very-short-patch-repair endonuclease
MRLVNYSTLVETVADLDKKGRRGVRPMRTLVMQRGSDYVPPESGLEGRLNSLLQRAGLPGVRRQVEVGGHQWLGRVDFRLGATPLVIEVQSDAYHWSLTSAEADRVREDAMIEAGFRVVPVWESALWSDGGAVVRAIEAAMAELRR